VSIPMKNAMWKSRAKIKFRFMSNISGSNEKVVPQVEMLFFIRSSSLIFCLTPGHAAACPHTVHKDMAGNPIHIKNKL